MLIVKSYSSIINPPQCKQQEVTDKTVKLLFKEQDKSDVAYLMQGNPPPVFTRPDAWVRGFVSVALTKSKPRPSVTSR